MHYLLDMLKGFIIAYDLLASDYNDMIQAGEVPPPVDYQSIMDHLG